MRATAQARARLIDKAELFMAIIEKFSQYKTGLSDLAGADAASAVELHGEGEQPHAREIVTLKLNAQADGKFAGYILLASEELLLRRHLFC